MDGWWRNAGRVSRGGEWSHSLCNRCDACVLACTLVVFMRTKLCNNYSHVCLLWYAYVCVGCFWALVWSEKSYTWGQFWGQYPTVLVSATTYLDISGISEVSERRVFGTWNHAKFACYDCDTHTDTLLIRLICEDTKSILVQLVH